MVVLSLNILLDYFLCDFVLFDTLYLLRLNKGPFYLVVSIYLTLFSLYNFSYLL